MRNQMGLDVQITSNHRDYTFRNVATKKYEFLRTIRYHILPYSFPSLQGWKGWMDGVRLRKKLKEVLEGVFFVTWWSIWKFRNQLLFGSVLPRKSLIFDDAVSSSFMWCSNRSDKRVDWRIWLQNPKSQMMYRYDMKDV
ncbi:hypothetical protein LXL04_008416 [Taraxacum kok-saghyz]